MTLQPPIPVLRIFDAALAKGFYGPVVLHLTEHYGDCSPWAKVFINTDDVDALHRELLEASRS